MAAAEDERTAGALAPGMIDPRGISGALRELSLSFRRYDRSLAQQMLLKPTDYQAMEHILEGGGTLGPLDLAGRLGLAPGTTSELLDRLEQQGHVIRDKDDHDRRRVRLAPTASTVAKIITAISPAATELDQLAAQFEPHEQEIISRFLLRATATLDAHSHVS